jgi:hypothetical protein
MIKRICIFVAVLAIPAAAIAQNVAYRPWCKNPAHGRSYSGGYGWIWGTFNTSDECWRYANGHRQQGHETGCSSVKATTGEWKD